MVLRIEDFTGLTFPLALAGYAFLALCVAWPDPLGPNRWLRALAAAVILLHVLCVWHFRFDWNATDAWSRSPAAFLLFHSALSIIVVAPCVPRKPARLLMRFAFIIVTVGALGATFRREEVAHYRLPVATVLLIAVTCLWKLRRNGGTPAA